MATPTSPAASTVSADVAYLRTLPAVRERCYKIFTSASAASEGEYFTYDASKEDDVADYCINIIQRDFGTNYAAIPPHGRWRHFDVGAIPRVTTLLSEWAGVGRANAAKAVEPAEAARRLVDLFMVSVLLDAGAGTKWKYEEKKTGLSYGRSEGLAVASLDMFLNGRFCGEQGDEDFGARHKVDAAGLKNLSSDMLAIDMQVHPTENPMTGLEGRANLLVKLGEALESDKHGFFSGPSSSAANIPAAQRRPGFLVDYLAAHPSTKHSPTGKGAEVSYPVLWEVLMYGLAPIWPASRTHLDGVAMGDVWPNKTLAKLNNVPLDTQGAMVPFHKLSQWMCYSLMEAMEKTLGWHFVDAQHGTGLPEYRNGGLFVDLGVLVPKQTLLEASGASEGSVPQLAAEHPAIVEWRALTVVLLDRTAERIRAKLGVGKAVLNLKQVLEAATWKGGREIAAEKRTGGGPPINVLSDGTVF
ncbi:hypothetical protein EX895_003777 [Sporisorium graminicola]|uniref:Uracil catabolism protein 4 n=1 Tax=Sporisorium graminicola TaxID=280036 RepID=A0A4U7KRN8_9BASI|nr:hypothetical protein EX895_003777 [Sporisorium graminicola]TKY87100.1 hypothetical protein EX895_003777 [Sporisorium graminicola]